MKSFFYFVLFGTLLAIGTGCGQDRSGEADSEPPVRPVRYLILKAETQDRARTFNGTAETEKESVLSFKVPGTVKTLSVKVGDRVTAGTLLAELDKTDLMVDLESARAGLKASQADAKSAETTVQTTGSNYRRIQQLYENDNVSLSEFEQARGDFETARAQLQAAKSRIRTENAKLRAARNQLEYARLQAPFDGVINQVAVEENEEVGSGAAIVTLSGLAQLNVTVNVSDLFIARISQNMACTVTFPALPETRFEGVVAEVPYAAADSPTYPVSIAITKPDDRLRPGMAAEVRFLFEEDAQDAGIFIPADSVGEEKGQTFVFLIQPGKDGNGLVRKHPVVLGELGEEGFRVIEGLSSGQMVATSGMQLLLDGMAVKLLDDPVKEW